MQAHVRAFRRSDHEVVLGVGSANPQVVSGLTDREAYAVVRLGALSPAQWRAAGSTRPPSDRWPSVLALVAEAAERVVLPSDQLESIALIGHEVALAPIAAALEPLTGRLIRDRLDVDAVETALLTGHCPDRPELAVIIGHDAMSPGSTRLWQAHGIPHLSVVFATDGCVVGPLVRAALDPCVHCLDLHRADHDPAWARVAAQGDDLSAHPAHPPVDVVALAAGLVGSVVRGIAAGAPLCSGVTITARPPRLDGQHQRWSRHPHCPRHVAAAAQACACGHGNAPARWPRPGH